MSSANLHLPQKAPFSRGQCSIKESVFFRVCVCARARLCVTVCLVSMMTCCQCPEERRSCASAVLVVQPGSDLFFLNMER